MPVSVYRGVHAKHPALRDALQGIASPGDLNGTVTPQQHNFGGVAADSPSTSWTHDVAVAMTAARRHGLTGGVLLETDVGPPPSGAQWSWEASPYAVAAPRANGKVYFAAANRTPLGTTIIEQ